MLTMLTMQINLNAASVFDGNIQSSLVEVSLAVHDKVRSCLLSLLLYISNLPRKDVQCSVLDRKNNDLYQHKIIYIIYACLFHIFHNFKNIFSCNFSCTF